MDQIVQPQIDAFAEANHRVANSLTLLGGLVRMQAKAAGRIGKSFTQAEVKLMLDGIAARTSMLGQLHRLLARSPSESPVSFNSHTREVCRNLAAAYSSEHARVSIAVSGDACLVAPKCVQPITLILCEIITNSVKYAHPAGMPVMISLLCEERGGVLEVTASDDGVGLPEGFDIAAGGGLGFQIIRALTQELGAAIDICSDSLGSTFKLTVPGVLVCAAPSAEEAMPREIVANLCERRTPSLVK